MQTKTIPPFPTTPLEDAAREMSRQRALWGDRRTNTNEAWLAILMKEVGEVAKQMNDDPTDLNLHTELIQVAAVALTWAGRVAEPFLEDREARHPTRRCASHFFDDGQYVRCSKSPNHGGRHYAEDMSWSDADEVQG